MLLQMWAVFERIKYQVVVVDRTSFDSLFAWRTNCLYFLMRTFIENQVDGYMRFYFKKATFNVNPQILCYPFPEIWWWLFQSLLLSMLALHCHSQRSSFYSVLFVCTFFSIVHPGHYNSLLNGNSRFFILLSGSCSTCLNTKKTVQLLLFETTVVGIHRSIIPYQIIATHPLFLAGEPFNQTIYQKTSQVFRLDGYNEQTYFPCRRSIACRPEASLSVRSLLGC